MAEKLQWEAMDKSRAHKYYNKFAGWAKHVGAVEAERVTAMEEFFVNPSRIPADCADQVTGLFEDWFLMERRLLHQGMTPLELFLHDNGRKLKEKKAEVYRRFAKENRYGVFKIEEVLPGEGLILKQTTGEGPFRVRDAMASKSGAEGEYLAARLFPFEDHWTFSSYVAGLPGEARYELDRLLSVGPRPREGERIRPRDVLRFYMPPVDWEREGLVRVRARLSMILQKWGVSDVTAAMVEEDILAAHAEKAKSHPLSEVVLKRAPSFAETQEATAVLTALWNLTLPGDEPRPGPREMALMRDLIRCVREEVPAQKKGTTAGSAEWAKSFSDAWMENPQADLGGRTPRQVILEERKTLGNPSQEVGFSVLHKELQGPVGEAEGAELANEGRRFISAGDGRKALEIYEKAYRLMKGSPDVFRILGNLATAHVMLGHRDEAMEALRAAIKVNPDYEIARNNLQMLSNMSDEEFKAKHDGGFFGKMQFIKE